MLQKMEPKIQRLEYRLAFAPAAAPVVEAEANPNPDYPPVETVATLVERIRELESQAAENERIFAEQLKQNTEAAFERGRAEQESGRILLLQKISRTLEQYIVDFAAVRDNYLNQVEHEVVRLALSIATRILHREAQMDPLLLSGAVRVALGQLSDSTEVQLHIPATEHALWEEMIRLIPNLPIRPKLFPEDSMAAGECVIETPLGSVDLGVKAQLDEIERGFFDLLDRRDQARRDDARPREA
ncbi:MAG TPA: FliH/SctL family protein [Edaphobacter sp.]|nr:FliH/SctL family protein [Edaphobacter sp.]